MKVNDNRRYSCHLVLIKITLRTNALKIIPNKTIFKKSYLNPSVVYFFFLLNTWVSNSFLNLTIQN